MTRRLGLLTVLIALPLAVAQEPPKEAPQPKAPAAAAATPDFGAVFFEKFDLNKDGSVTWEEYQKVHTGFAALDADNNGVITAPDIAKCMERRQKHMQEAMQRRMQGMRQGMRGQGMRRGGFGQEWGRGMSNEGFGPPWARQGRRGGRGMGGPPWMQRGREGPGGFGPGFGGQGGPMGPGMGRGMGPGMGRGMGPGMGRGMGPGMGRGMGWGFGAPPAPQQPEPPPAPER